MKIIKVTPDIDYGTPYTVDSTLVKVDSSLVTVDKTIDEVIQVNYLKILPSTIATSYTVVFINELTKVINTYSGCQATVINKIVNILLPDMTLAEGERFNVEVKNNNTIVWRGQVMATDKDTQDYQQSIIENNKIKF